MLANLSQKLRLTSNSIFKVFSPSVISRTTESTLVAVTHKKWDFTPNYIKPRQLWIENIDTAAESKLGILELHPDVYAASPRIDIIHQNVRWQTNMRKVSYAHSKTRAEVRGGGRKPWPQKGLGKARHGSIRSPLWRGGGVAHGPRHFKTYFFMLPFAKRLIGLTSSLSVKLAQDDLHIVNNLEIPTDDTAFMEELIETRNWGPSVLIVDDTDIMPRNITLATDALKHVNLMPAYGLNVYSMLKHETLVLTVAAAERIESKLLEHLNANNPSENTKKFKVDQ